MSVWSYIEGTIDVCGRGRTQPEIEYVLKTVLQHLPVVSGSERNMSAHICMRSGFDSYVSHDEFWQNPIPNYVDRYGCQTTGMAIQHNYIIVVEGNLRDAEGRETYRQFIRWLSRLSKRILVSNVLVRIWDTDGDNWVIDEPEGNCKFLDTYPDYGEPCWTDYLLWEHDKNSWYPKRMEAQFRGGKSGEKDG